MADSIKDSTKITDIIRMFDGKDGFGTAYNLAGALPAEIKTVGDLKHKEITPLRPTQLENYMYNRLDLLKYIGIYNGFLTVTDDTEIRDIVLYFKHTPKFTLARNLIGNFPIPREIKTVGELKQHPEYSMQEGVLEFISRITPLTGGKRKSRRNRHSKKSRKNHRKSNYRR